MSEQYQTIKSVAIQQQTLLAERYLILKQISTGGMGTVYLAEDIRNKNFRLAVKVLHKNFQQDKQYLARFKQEVEICNKISHPNVLKIFDLYEIENRMFFTMEHITGKSVDEILDESYYPKNKLAKLVIEVADGLRAIHKHGVTHRDIKPANIMIQPDGSVKIIDFGVSRPENSQLTQKNFKLGSLCYIAPEVWMGKTPGVGSDLYALGVLLFECLTRKLPFESDNLEALAKYHASKEPVELPLDTPKWIADLIHNLLSKDPKDRLQSADEVIKFVQTHSLDGQEVQTFEDSMQEQTIRSGKSIISTFPNIGKNSKASFTRDTIIFSLKATKSDYEEETTPYLHKKTKTVVINLPRNAALVFEFEFPTREFLYLGFFLASLNILDGFLTRQGMYTLGTSSEGNPVMYKLMELFGIDNTLLITKGLAVSVVLGMTVMARKSRKIKDLVGFLSCFYAIAAIIPWIYILYYR